MEQVSPYRYNLRSRQRVAEERYPRSHHRRAEPSPSPTRSRRLSHLASRSKSSRPARFSFKGSRYHVQPKEVVSSPSPIRRPMASTKWRDTDRIAEFVANCCGGFFVVIVLCSYLVTYLVQVYEEADWSNMRATILSELCKFIPIVLKCIDFISESDQDCWFMFQSLEEAYAFVLNPANSAQIAGLMAVFVIFGLAASKYKWIGWYCGLQFLVIIQWIIALYQVVRIALSLFIYCSVKLIKFIVRFTMRIYLYVTAPRNKQVNEIRQTLKRAESYKEWRDLAQSLDELEGKEGWKNHLEEEECDFVQLKKNIKDLQYAIDARNIGELRYLIAAFVMRDKLGIDSPTLHLQCKNGTKNIIKQYTQLILIALKTLNEANPREFPKKEKIYFFKQMKQSFGSTGLCLSGGGALAMYHMGIVKALLEADLLPNVISGSSGGSIVAAFTACKTNEELLNDVIQNDIAIRYIPLGIRWFPPLIQQLLHCIKTGILVECSDFERTTHHYFSEPLDAEEKTNSYTFQEAFKKTGRHVSITVSASDMAGNMKGPKKLLLNHITSPHVLIWSAVAVSCSLPGIMKHKQLLAKDYYGHVVPYVSLGKEWIDGSIQQDLPMETMSSCFNVTNFIVSQVNPHVVPFIGEEINIPQLRNSPFHTLESVIAADVRHRLKMLAFLGLFPKIYGQRFSSYFRQNFVGNVTIVPKFIFAESIGIKAILNPTIQDMERYIKGGQRATWPKISYIRHLCSIEKGLDELLANLLGEEIIPFQNWLHP